MSKPIVRAKRKPSPRLRHHSRFLVLPAEFPAAPLTVYDPNGEYAHKTGHEIFYRPIWIRDAHGKDVLHVGVGSRAFRLAAHLVHLYNKETLKGKS